MMIWLALSLIFLLTLALMLVPLYRYQSDPAASESPVKNNIKNIAVYKSQLSELQSDLDNGVLSPAEVAAARLEIERRLLRISSEKDTIEPKNNETSLKLLTVIISLVLLGSTAFYLNIGMPGMPDFALKDQAHSTAQRTKSNSASPDMIAEVAKIQAHLRENPDDVNAWRALGQYQTDLQNRVKAAEAFQHWFELDDDNIDAALMFSESLIMLSDGRVSPAALLALDRAQKIQPDNPGVRHYLALAEYQAGNVDQALVNWQALMADSPANAPWRRSVQRWISQAQNDLGLPVTNSTAVAPPLSEENRKVIAEMSAQEQEALIKSMVARLARKMDENPENTEGWFRLAKAYMMLGQKSDAIKSLEQAEKYAPDALKPQIKKQLEILLK
ncbi:MAG: c-type cytochrome biogenesis protein CcmI [Emcibacter sp.]|nr:c-type cytochrome biogenesis protein CcmI [Emcibacter sp.]